MDALSEAILRLLRRQEQSDRRLEQIERTLGLSQQPAPEPQPPPPPASAPPSPPSPITYHPSPTLEARVGLTWVNRIGAVTLLLGAAFFFKYAVDNEWIGPAGRVILGLLTGFAMLGLADRLWRRGQRIFAQGLSGGGGALLYLSLYAAFALYHLVPRPAAFLLLLLTTTTTGALALRYQAQAIAALGLLGGYLTPILLSTGEDRPWFFFTYILLLNAAALALATVRRWPQLPTLAFAATVLLYSLWFLDRYRFEKRLVATVFALAYYTLFALTPSRWRWPAAQLLAAVALPLIWGPRRVTFLVLSLALAVAGAVIADWRRLPHGIWFAFTPFWLSYAMWHRASSPTGPTLLLLTAVFLLWLAWLPWQMLGRQAPPTGRLLLVPVLNAALYFGYSHSLLEDNYADYLGLFAAALAGLHLALGWSLFRRYTGDRRPVLLLIGIALTLLTLAVPIQFRGYRITMAWTLEAAALAWIGVRAAEIRLQYAALAVFLLAVFRLHFIDSWVATQTTLWNLRFLTFFIAALSLAAAAWWFRTGWMGLAPYVTAHFVLLWGLVLEVVDFAVRNVSPENLSSARTMFVSILLALYAVLLVAGGVLSRGAVNRLLGLGLIVIVIVKLYFYDIWLLSRVFRITAFSALGVLLLLISYLYSHHRERIESWWTRDSPGS